MKLKVGVIGLGFMGSAHARVYSTLKDCELIAVCDSNPNKKVIAKTCGCNFFKATEDFFSEKLDAVSVCTPTSIHNKVVLDALDYGKHVLVEKPFADSLSHGEEMKKKAVPGYCNLKVLTVSIVQERPGRSISMGQGSSCE